SIDGPLIYEGGNAMSTTRSLRKSVLTALCTLSLAAVGWGAVAASAAKGAGKPAIKILATGGTIAGAQAGSSSYGYKAGAFKVEDLIKAVPKIDQLADLSGE